MSSRGLLAPFYQHPWVLGDIYLGFFVLTVPRHEGLVRGRAEGDGSVVPERVEQTWPTRVHADASVKVDAVSRRLRTTEDIVLGKGLELVENVEDVSISVGSNIWHLVGRISISGGLQ